jgi:hypothetical protein
VLVDSDATISPAKRVSTRNCFGMASWYTSEKNRCAASSFRYVCTVMVADEPGKNA